MNEDDNKIITACQKGNHKEFGKLYDAYIRRIYDFIYFKTFHKETAEDLTSQTFMKALENIGRFKSELGTFSAWLYQIARNTVIDSYRTRKTETDIEDVWDLSSETDIEADLDNRERLSKLKKYLSRLTPKQRDVIIMRVWQEMSYAEIAEITGQSESGCRMMFSRTIGILKSEMPMALFIMFLMKII